MDRLESLQAHLEDAVKAKQAYWKALRELETMHTNDGEWSTSQGSDAEYVIKELAALGGDKVSQDDLAYFLNLVGPMKPAEGE